MEMATDVYFVQVFHPEYKVWGTVRWELDREEADRQMLEVRELFPDWDIRVLHHKEGWKDKGV